MAVGGGEVKRGGSAPDPEPEHGTIEVTAECVALRASHAVRARARSVAAEPPGDQTASNRTTGGAQCWRAETRLGYAHTQGGTDNVTEVVSRVARPWDGTGRTMKWLTSVECKVPQTIPPDYVVNSWARMVRVAQPVMSWFALTCGQRFSVRIVVSFDQ